ncbi:MAG: B-box zinc finger protein [Armatimonadetes bacterium]|nr:B-box zinc finger protein [Armatimonadota bacterium]
MKDETTTAEGVTHCARHPNVETGLTCATCGTPICPKCMVVTPVGMKCPDCGRVKNSLLFHVTPGRFLLAGITALAAGVVTTIIGALGFFAIFLLIPYGYFAGTLILKASGMKRGLKLEALAGVGMVLGALAVRMMPALVLGKPSLAMTLLIAPFFWIAVIIATSCAVSKIRYM